jgi:hypothetical protein
MLEMQLRSARKRLFRKKIPNRLPKGNLAFVLTTKRIKILCNKSLLCMYGCQLLLTQLDDLNQYLLYAICLN